uniref:Uncharacterized protein n=2 Tax=Meloidogyne TaxID=189290 RepID=A0A6V7TRH5_MELEN|nr:unnamed protein product [Meloidogyne enterolobii]
MSANDSGSSSNSTVSTYSPEEVAEKLNFGDDFAKWLAKQEFSDDDPLLILDFGTNVTHQRKLDVLNALIQNGGQKSDFLNTIFKFDTYEDLHNAKRALRQDVPWAYFSTIPMYDRHARADLPTVPEVSTTLVAAYNKNTNKLTMEPFQFFELF